MQILNAMRYIILTLTLLFSLSLHSQVITSIEDSETINVLSVDAFTFLNEEFVSDEIYENGSSVSVKIVKQQDEFDEITFFYAMTLNVEDVNGDFQLTIILNQEEAESLKKLIDNIWAKRKEKSISMQGYFDGELFGEYLFTKGKLFITDMTAYGGNDLYPNTIIESTTDEISLTFELKGIKKLKKSLESFTSLFAE